MLTARRFTIVPTKDCRERLETALTNQRPIARGETHRGAVVAVQSALADLNRGYLLSAEVDGFFGPRTYAAVEAFQRDYGLAADGIVGRQTMSQLDTLYSADVVRQPLGRSIHVGVDRVDPDHYGDPFTLASCVNDARHMRDLAESLGYDATVLENEEATTANFTGHMRNAVTDLYDGDALLITFSGHGSQLPNTSADDEADLLDETLCFFDRMLIDDELYALLGDFRAGVRIHAVFDSCHSGTAMKDIMVQADLADYLEQTTKSLKALTTVTIVAGAPPRETGPAGNGEEQPTGQPIATKSLEKALDGEKPDLAAPPTPKKDLTDDLAGLFTDLHQKSLYGHPKNIQLFQPIYDRNKDLYDAIKNIVGPKENQQLACTVVALSACQDPQTTPAGQVLSLFTYNVSAAWGTGGFIGSYSQFHRNVRNVSPPTSTPEIHTYGTGRAEARLYERPFVF